jgi:NAD(P)-dependent dehydrogenase (short-subunit alcohol dehydrogenase family)
MKQECKIGLNRSLQSLSGVANSGKPSLAFSGKTILITGSGTGIGQAIATKFAESGANIVIMGRRQKPLDETKEKLLRIISSVGSSAYVLSFPGVDVSDERSLLGMYRSLEENSKRLDIIVNNAGVSGPVKVFANADYKEFKECVAIHLSGTYYNSIYGLKSLSKNGKIITISTFFTEENKFEQRPYRFRTPYTAAQGAKNRLAEALAWELADLNIRSLATNPGPVHSDRIYRTVYPKAAAEFLRIGGFKNMKASVIEYVLTNILPYLGEDASEFEARKKKIAEEMVEFKMIQSDVDTLEGNITDLLVKLYNIAEKIQDNTKKMIVDAEFLAQEDVAEMVYTLSSEKISRLVNGRVIPNDRVFYTVRPSVSNVVQEYRSRTNLGNLLISTSTNDVDDLSRIKSQCQSLNHKVKQIIIVSSENFDQLSDLPQYQTDLSDEDDLIKSLNRIKNDFGIIEGLIHFTGQLDYSRSLMEISNQDWESLVRRFVLVPSLMTKQLAINMAPQGALQEPAKFRDSTGNMVVVGPDWPKGAKISGLVKARAEVFRGALRPLTVTVNQELSDVLGSRMRLYLVLPGNVDNGEVDDVQLRDSITNLVLRSGGLRQNETIFYLGN